MNDIGQPAAFLVDSPERLDEDSDAFGHRDYAQAIAETLIAAPTPFTVGVFGPWGVGKSTIIGEVRRRLPDRVGFAYYDAWRYEGDALRRQLLRDVARQLHASQQLKGFDPDKDLEELEVTVQATKERIEFSWPRFLRSLVGASLLAAMVYLFLRDRQGAALFSGHEPLTDAGVGALVFLASGLLTLLREPFQVTQRVLGTQRLEEPDRFAAKFEELMASVRSERVVIAIDNLDRCSPDRAVEILSTIKTYLEPAFEPDSERRWLPPLRADGRTPKPAVFLIAADIEALRRHLLSKELEGTGQPPAEASRYVDEYLRKFFSATLPIRASLDTEMRSYVASQLAELVSAAKLDERERKKLVEMVAAALRRNPRRVKQFANNLEIRLQLLAARETEVPGHSAMIRPPISDRPLAVAKLALIEEEWPAYFKALFARPRCLQQWELAARGVGQLGPGVAGPPAEQPRDVADSVDDWPALAAFLRASDGVSIESPRPFLRLKQSETEVRLPGFAEFTESIAAGERESAMAILSQATEEQRRGLEAELCSVLSRELNESYIQGALQVVDLVVSQPAIDPQIRSEVLYNAVSDPRIKHELARLDPRLLLAAGRGLQQTSYRELQTLVADRLPSGDANESEQRAIAIALTALGDELSADARQHIRLAIDQTTLPQRPDVVAIFAEFDDALMTEQAMHHQLQQFMGGQPQGAKPGQLESGLRIVLAGIREYRDKQAADTVANYISTALTDEIAHPEAIQDIDLYIGAIDSISPLVPQVVTTLAQSIVAALTNLAVEFHGPFLRILGSAIVAVDESQRTQFADEAISQLFRNPDVAVVVLEQHGRGLQPVFRPLVFQRLAALLQSGAAVRSQATSLLDEFGTVEEANTAITDAAQAALQSDDFGWVTELVLASPASFPERGSAMLEHTLNRITQVDIGPRTQALALAAELSRFSDATQRVRLTSLLQDQILDADPGHAELAIATAQAMAANDTIDFDLGTIIAASAQRVLNTPPQQFQAFHLLRFVCAHLAALPDDEPDGLYRHVKLMLTQPEHAQSICDALAAVPDSYPEARSGFTRVLLEGSREGAPQERTILLRAAQALAANTPGAKAAVDQRIAELATSEDAGDQEVYAALQA
jgi:hypothetical protein